MHVCQCPNEYTQLRFFFLNSGINKLITRNVTNFLDKKITLSVNTCSNKIDIYIIHEYIDKIDYD